MPRRVVVSDSSVLIDLERGSFFAAAFALPFEFCVPDLLYRRELEPLGGDHLVQMGLRVLWLLDRISQECSATPKQLYDGLVRIRAPPAADSPGPR